MPLANTGWVILLKIFPDMAPCDKGDGEDTACQPPTSATPVMLGPNITGTMITANVALFVEKNFQGALSGNTFPQRLGPAGATTGTVDVSNEIFLNASDSNAIFNNSQTVQPNALSVQYLIRY